jgi:hypothetical protein
MRTTTRRPPRARSAPDPAAASVERPQRRADCSYPCNSGALAVITCTHGALLLSLHASERRRVQRQELTPDEERSSGLRARNRSCRTRAAPREYRACLPMSCDTRRAQRRALARARRQERMGRRRPATTRLGTLRSQVDKPRRRAKLVRGGVQSLHPGMHPVTMHRTSAHRALQAFRDRGDRI